ncbi:tripartite tricarboxylate transporter substrate binding protein [Aneurinibacillus sp. Ricciae_BoGa-3]|uniref:Bug family tripartite tricarboxylate transporter substrate binding protein n=1 Tax=Aneurinibacillus sp. Ricciae_BoGa-3 TaxID=3022697 RepID=UPI0023415554|nr:tripartite tricarboxylate transporter substrate binding protein [Aneurinibacillus sp. Ricciae_BoGa-3]WCK52310.1 tripartite tricarboxylate transporter substrate binding protein [Aneurinibacillus sp. Ricciae_BoGa-3]
MKNIRRKQGLLKIVCAALGITTILSGCSAAKTSNSAKGSSDQYPKQTITFVVPYSPGGDFDTTARILVPFLSEYLPNKPSVIVKNVPGGNSVVGTENILHAKPDGYTIGYFTLPGIALGPLIGNGDYDLTKVEWIGQVFNLPYVAAASKTANIKDIKSLKALPKLRVGTTGITTSAGLGSFIASKELNIHPTFVPSGGSSESVMAASQGSVDFVQFPYPAMRQQIEAGLIKPVWTYSKERLKNLPNVPTIGELGYPQLSGLVNLVGAVGTTPGVSKEHLQILRDALKKAMEDPKFLDKMNKQYHSPQYLNADDTLKEVKDDIESLKKYADPIKNSIKN